MHKKGHIVCRVSTIFCETTWGALQSSSGQSPKALAGDDHVFGK